MDNNDDQLDGRSTNSFRVFGEVNGDEHHELIKKNRICFTRYWMAAEEIMDFLRIIRIQLAEEEEDLGDDDDDQDEHTNQSVTDDVHDDVDEDNGDLVIRFDNEENANPRFFE